MHAPGIAAKLRNALPLVRSNDCQLLVAASGGHHEELPLQLPPLLDDDEVVRVRHGQVQPLLELLELINGQVDRGAVG